MPKKKTPEDIFQRARENGSDINKEIINGTEIKKHLEPKTEKNYTRALDLWNGYVYRPGRLRIFVEAHIRRYAQTHLAADPYDLETLMSKSDLRQRYGRDSCCAHELLKTSPRVGPHTTCLCNLTTKRHGTKQLKSAGQRQ